MRPGRAHSFAAHPTPSVPASSRAAGVFGLEFFEHLPCCPRCRPTRARNRGLVEALYDDAGAARVRDALSQSVLLWPDGRFLPFRCTGSHGGTLRAADVGRARGEIRPHLRDRLLAAPPNGAGCFDALRRTRRGWEGRAAGRWRRLSAGSGEPLVLAFSVEA